MPLSAESDAIIIGAGHNGLVCAYYLARAGLKVTVLERRGVVGGAAVTEEFHPGFRNSVASYTVSLLNPKIIREMDLAAYGLKIVERKLNLFLPLNDRDYLAMGGGRTQQEIAKFSARDAAQFPAYEKRLEAVAEVLRALVLQTPPNLTQGGIDGVLDMLKSAALVRKLGKLDLTAKRDLLALFMHSAGDWLDGWFESDALKGLLGVDGIVGSFASPYTPGTAYVLLHHCFGEVNGKTGVWGHAIGGMGAITQAMAQACAAKGVTIHTESAVKEVIIEKDRAAGVATASGDVFRARMVVSNLNPKILYGQLIDHAHLPADFVERMARYKNGSASFRMNVALSELPRFSCLPENGDHLTAGIVVAPSLAYMDRAYMDARAHGWSKAPIIEMLIPSTLDDSLAPPGRHVASLFCQHTAPQVAGGWDAHREAVADLMIDTVDRLAPGFKASVIARQALSPLDLERVFGLTGGDIFHGQLELGQLFSARPVLGHGNYRSPIRGLYMCGSGTHPGGGVTGAPGHNAAREILKDKHSRR